MNSTVDIKITEFRQHLRLAADASGAARKLAQQFRYGDESPALFQESDIQLDEAYALLLDIAHIERGRAGLLTAVDGMIDILSALFDLLDVTPEVESWWVNTIDAFRRDALAHNQSVRSEDLARVPLKEQNVIRFFLATSRKRILNNNSGDGAERWHSLCLAGYRATRLAARQAENQLERGSLTLTPEKLKEQERLWWNRVADKCACAIESVLLHSPVESWEREGVWTTFHRGLVYEAFLDCWRAKKYTYETAEYYRRIAGRLFRGYYHYWINASRQPSESGERERGGEGRGALANRRAKGSWEDRKQLEIDEGAAPSELDLQAATLTLRAAPRGSAAHSRVFRPPNAVPVWSQSHITAEMTGLLLAKLTGGLPLTEIKTPQLAVLTFLLVQLSCGI